MIEDIEVKYEHLCVTQMIVYYKFSQIVDEKELLCILPRRCSLTGKSLFLKQAVRLQRRLGAIYSPGGAQPKYREEYLWVDPRQLLLFKLKNAEEIAELQPEVGALI